MAPAELEAALLENQHVADAAVCAVQIEHEELPRAYVALKERSKGKISEQDITGWLAERVAKHKRLTGGLKVRPERPFTDKASLIVLSSSTKFRNPRVARFSGL